jgi:hydroxymethylglutaryl-CoA reductase (NADPH)
MDKAAKRIKKTTTQILSNYNSIENFTAMIESKEVGDLKPIPSQEPYSEAGKQLRLKFLKNELNKELPVVSGTQPISNPNIVGNIENYIGMAQIPIGIMGPLKVKGIYANASYYIPLATTEGALVASYHRGAKACTLSGGVSSIFLGEGVQRCPLMLFNTVSEAGVFAMWMIQQIKKFKTLVSKYSSHAVLQEVEAMIQGNQVILTFDFSTGDASGQNMVTICTQAICEYIVTNSPVSIKKWYIEGNYSGDKKANSVSFARVRGRKVTAEVSIPEDVVKSVLKTTPYEISEYWKASTVAVLQTGSLGAQGHFANGLTAMFIACGQDVACVSEAAVGITRMEVAKNGNLYASVTLPNLIVGSVGGGTNLPTQKECLELMDCHGTGKANKFAEICAAVVLSGEISIAAAMSAGHFTSAHQDLGRRNK